jgi:hypothetical protein
LARADGNVLVSVGLVRSSRPLPERHQRNKVRHQIGGRRHHITSQPGRAQNEMDLGSIVKRRERGGRGGYQEQHVGTMGVSQRSSSL